MYAVLADLQARIETAELIQLSDEDREGVIKLTVIDQVLGAADSEINSFVGVVYDVTKVGSPAVLVEHACTIARYKLWVRKGDVPEAIKDAYDAAVRWLKLLAEGKAKLDVAGVEVAAAPNTVVFEAPPRAFSRDSLQGF